jgi:hypothetical protein
MIQNNINTLRLRLQHNEEKGLLTFTSLSHRNEEVSDISLSFPHNLLEHESRDDKILRKLLNHDWYDSVTMEEDEGEVVEGEIVEGEVVEGDDDNMERNWNTHYRLFGLPPRSADGSLPACFPYHLRHSHHTSMYSSKTKRSGHSRWRRRRWESVGRGAGGLDSNS